jgi:nitrate/nitrite transport system permease protein
MPAASKAVAVSPATAVPVPGTSAEIVTFRPPLRPALERAGEMARHVAGVVLPPLIVIALSLLVWELLCRKAGSRLPPPIARSWPIPGN